MDSLIFSLNAVLPLFTLVVLGYAIRKTNLVNDEWLTMANKFSFNVTFSIMLFNDIYKTDFSGGIPKKLILFAVLAVLSLALVCYLTIPFIVKNRFRTGVVMQGIFRTNFLLFGMPLVVNMFGEGGRPYASLLVAIIIPIYNVLAVVTLSIFNQNTQKKIDVKKILKGLVTNPLILGTLSGFLFIFLKIPLPEFLLNTMGQISNIAVPLALIILGAQFKFAGFLKNIKPVSLTVLTKLVVVPMIMLPIAILLGFRGLDLGIILAIFTSPCAVSSSIMAYNMGGDGDLAGQIVVFGTLTSVVTIFLFIFGLNSLGYL